MTTLFDYLDAYVYAYLAADELAAEPGAGGDGPPDPALDGAAASVETIFGGLGADGWEPAPDLLGAAGAGATPAVGSPAEAWLSGDEWSGEAEIGGTSLTSGTVDTSGSGNDVYSVDGEVLDLP